jgi:deoxyribonuclease-1-like protein
MKKSFLCIINLSFTCILYAQISLCSWNLENFGTSKTDAAIEFIANTLKDYDVLAIQEVVAGDGGAYAVARLSAALNRKGTKWDYRVSEPTSGENSYKKERYGFLWKTSKVSLAGKPWLEIRYNVEIDREPYLATFTANGKPFTIVNFHAITKSKQPETEIKYFKFFPAEYADKNLIFCGDFNCPQSHTVFNPLKSLSYTPVFKNQKTSLKQECVNSYCLASEFDNIFYNLHKINFVGAGVIHFYKGFSTLKEARKISDHIPVHFEFGLN